MGAADWPSAADWERVGSVLVNTTGSADPLVASACRLTTADYYVEADIRPNTVGSWHEHLGVVARLEQAVGEEATGGYRGVFSLQSFCGGCGFAEIVDVATGTGNGHEFGLFEPEKIYKVRLAVQGTSISLFLDGNPEVEKIHTSANRAGRVGVQCSRPCEVLSFVVVAL